MKSPIFLTSFLAAAGLALTAAPALAQDACANPTAPPAVNGATASMEQLLAAKAQAADFIAASDSYQTCLIDGGKAQEAAAKAAKTKFDKAITKDINAKVDENQKLKAQVGDNFNKAVKAYKAAHPG